MHNKTRDIKDLNVRAMVSLIAFVDNGFIPTNAALDLKIAPCEISSQMKRIESSFDFDFFVREKRNQANTRKYITGLTNQGKLLFSKIKWFIESMELQHEGI